MHISNECVANNSVIIYVTLRHDKTRSVLCAVGAEKGIYATTITPFISICQFCLLITRLRICTLLQHLILNNPYVHL